MIRLRAHHGMCLYYFKGKGYSDSFVANMHRYKELLENEDPVIELTASTDALCAGCPHNHVQLCDTATKVLNYDKIVLELCGLCEGEKISYHDFSAMINSRIIEPGKRPEICSDCQWTDLCI